MSETIRTFLAKRFRMSYAILLVAIICFMAPKYVQLPATTFGQETHDVTLGLGAIFIAIGAILGLRVRCPKCNKRLDRAIGSSLAIPAVGGKVNNCPYCGVSFDDPMPNKGPIH